MSFDGWLEETDKEFKELTGVSLWDVEDQDWVERFESKMWPKEAAMEGYEEWLENNRVYEEDLYDNE